MVFTISIVISIWKEIGDSIKIIKRDRQILSKKREISNMNVAKE